MEIGNNAELEAKITLLEQEIIMLKEELENKKDKTLYSVSFGVTNSKVEPVNGTILMPGSSSIFSQGGQAISTIISDDITLSPNNKLTLPKVSYTFGGFLGRTRKSTKACRFSRTSQKSPSQKSHKNQ